MIVAMQPLDGHNLRLVVVAGMSVIPVIVVMAMRVIMIVVVVVVVTVIAARTVYMFCSGLFRNRGGWHHRIAETGNLAADRLQIAGRIVLHAHGTGGDGNGNLRNPRHAAHGGIDLAGAGGAIHAAHPKPALFHIGHRTFLFRLVRMFYDL